MIKARCTKCNKIIEINENDVVTKCPICGQEIFVKDSFKNLQDTYYVSLKKGELYFNGLTNYKKAYEMYTKALETKPDSLKILFDTIFARLYCSTIHENYIKDTTDLLLKYSDNISIDNEGALNLSSYMQKFRTDNRLIVEEYKKYCHESRYCKNNYINTLKDYEYFINKYLEIYNSLDKLNQFFKDNPEILNEELKFIKEELNSEIKTKRDDEKRHEIIDGNKNLINDIFPNKSKLFKVRMVLYACMGVGAITTIVGLILISNNSINKIASGITLGIGLALFFGGYFIGHKLRSKQYNLNY